MKMDMVEYDGGLPHLLPRSPSPAPATTKCRVTCNGHGHASLFYSVLLFHCSLCSSSLRTTSSRPTHLHSSSSRSISYHHSLRQLVKMILSVKATTSLLPTTSLSVAPIPT